MCRDGDPVVRFFDRMQWFSYGMLMTVLVLSFFQKTPATAEPKPPPDVVKPESK